MERATGAARSDYDGAVMKRRTFLAASGAALGSIVLKACGGFEDAAAGDATHGRIMPTGDVARLGWEDFLARWERQALSIVREHRLDIGENMVRFARTGTLSAGPARASEIDTREEDLGIALPTTLRAFLLVSNGWRSTDLREYTINPLAEIDWLAAADPEFLRIWQDGRSDVPEVGPEYDDYGPDQDPVYFRASELHHCLALSSTRDDAPTYLLNGARRASDGELEAWDLHFRLPGALRYRSFAGLMEVLYQEEIETLRYFAERREN